MRYGTEEQPDELRRHTKLWSLAGHQDDDWMQAEILLHLVDDGVPFQMEIRPTEIFANNGHMHFDDINFLNCGNYLRDAMFSVSVKLNDG